jgi:hypothetical protein
VRGTNDHFGNLDLLGQGCPLQNQRTITYHNRSWTGSNKCKFDSSLSWDLLTSKYKVRDGLDYVHARVVYATRGIPTILGIYMRMRVDLHFDYIFQDITFPPCGSTKSTLSAIVSAIVHRPPTGVCPNLRPLSTRIIEVIFQHNPIRL